MPQRIAHIALVVRDYDEAIDFYVNKLDFVLLEDTKLSEEKRWVMVAPNGAKECSLLLAKAADETSRKYRKSNQRTSFLVSFYRRFSAGLQQTN
ncbi:MAG: catechol 2,3-dioxygenase-like lactoylglutathione lyase family enzyme [Spirosomataceae bacterium]|jgi:catechol 2,3-dioxygenase-like lactoylglutathione lyase family enzyme